MLQNQNEYAASDLTCSLRSGLSAGSPGALDAALQNASIGPGIATSAPGRTGSAGRPNGRSKVSADQRAKPPGDESRYISPLLDAMRRAATSRPVWAKTLYGRLWIATLAALALAIPDPAAADSLSLPSSLSRTGDMVIHYRLDRPTTGLVILELRWTDGAGRLIVQQSASVLLLAANAIPVTLDLRRAVVMDNRLEARLLWADGAIGGTASAAFVANPVDPWLAYPIIMWQDQAAPRAAALRRLGISAGRVFGTRGPLSPDSAGIRAAPLVAADLPFYVENIATDFYAPYHRFQPGRSVTAAFDDIRALAAKDPDDPAIFQRQPSLSDPTALASVATRLSEHAAMFRRYRPLFYSLGDETGIADLAAAWDFDLGAASLDAMRTWLRNRYGGSVSASIAPVDRSAAALAALNTEWGRTYSDWSAVTPMTTTTALNIATDNFAPWMDFKEAMDAAFASAVQAGTDAIHSSDPMALSAIEGAQVPGWGGYDYTKLAHAVDAMELYDFGNNVEIVRSLNPALKVLTTLGADMPDTAQTLWRGLLRGNRAVIVWDDAHTLVNDAGEPSVLGLSTGRLLREFESGIAAQIVASTPIIDPIAILYSPASFRVDWLLNRRAEKRDWMARTSEVEGQDTAMRASMRDAAFWVKHTGRQPNWVSEHGLSALQQAGTRLLLLPDTIALSQVAVAQIESFVRNGGTVLAAGMPGLYDDHGKPRGKPPLQGVVALVPGWPQGATGLEMAGPAAITLSHDDGTPILDVDVRMFRNGAVTVIGLQRDMPTAGADVEVVHLSLATPAHIYDMRRHTALGFASMATLLVGANDPVLLAVAADTLPDILLHGPADAITGATIDLQIMQAGRPAAAARVVRVETRKPDGELMEVYSGLTVLRGGSTPWSLPLALNDSPGRWTVTVLDRLGDGTATVSINVRAAGQERPCGAPACRQPMDSHSSRREPS